MTDKGAESGLLDRLRAANAAVLFSRCLLGPKSSVPNAEPFRHFGSSGLQSATSFNKLAPLSNKSTQTGERSCETRVSVLVFADHRRPTSESLNLKEPFRRNTLDPACELPAKFSPIFTAEQVCVLKSLWGKCLLVPTDKPNLLSQSNTDFWNVPNREHSAGTGMGALCRGSFPLPPLQCGHTSRLEFKIQPV